MHDLIIVGSGPAGLSAAVTAERRGYDYLVLERGAIANTITRFPLARKLFSTANELELRPGDLDPCHKPTREELLDYYYRVTACENLRVKAGVKVENVRFAGNRFEVTCGNDVLHSRCVLAAVGGFGKQRKLEVAGETRERVSYAFAEAYLYALKAVLVVGGGNSGAEAALALADAGARVTLSVRRSSLDLPPSLGDGSPPQRAQIKPWVRGPLDEAVAAGKVSLVVSSKVIELDRGRAVLQIDEENKRPRLKEIECDHVFALIGADPDNRLLSNAGAEIAADGRVVYNSQTYETRVRGLYVAGHLTRERHIKNAISVARNVVEKLDARVFERCEV